MAEANVPDLELDTEALKLLVQVAWANDHVHAKERELLERLAKAWKVPHVLESLLGQIDRKEPLAQPNLPLLRTRADKVLNAAQALIAVDGEVDEDEDAMLAELKTLLGVR